MRSSGWLKDPHSSMEAHPSMEARASMEANPSMEAHRPRGPCRRRLESPFPRNPVCTQRNTSNVYRHRHKNTHRHTRAPSHEKEIYLLVCSHESCCTYRRTRASTLARSHAHTILLARSYSHLGTDANDDDGDGLARRVDDRLDGLLLVRDVSVCSPRKCSRARARKTTSYTGRERG